MQQRLLELILSCFDYEKFVVLMKLKVRAKAREEREAKERAEEEECKGTREEDLEMFDY